MTRINLISTKKLADQHLMAEYRELPRIFTYVKKYGIPDNNDIPDKYKFGKGHIKFFSNKLKFLSDRYSKIVDELKRRNFDISFEELKPFCYELLDSNKQIKYQPTKEEIDTSKKRILEKLEEKPKFYKWNHITIL